ncbi:rhamnogalacturonan acetylesterase [Brevundimonas sp. PAMC22021]|uniref:rhamnogalacturonan acetylesterase n=1 Tax=Brevundimonas sp. PAMC22021 TaxID=2861285 RepID=UPI001C63217B|nr:rhamnogalacturonan acetylesterase [Brevundimonas sp. PAMC22021]QYF88193.1 rhamnogalacturonan acetylesterase [Brevundimonas sp. PAMC22021]
MLTALLLSGVILAQTPQAASPVSTSAPTPVVPISASKIILVGDSTTAVIGGWGPSFCADHVTSFVACVNLARGGRSSGSYIAEGSWDLALAEMSTPGFTQTYVLIQFGHNDQPGKPGRSTDLATEFPANLKRYVDETRARGAVPVLLTPLTRRQFVDGRLQNDLTPWADAVRRVAEDTQTPVVDLNASSAAAVQALGPMMSARFAQLPPSPEVAAALLTGTTIPGSTGVAPTPAPVTPAAPSQTSPLAQNNAAVEPLGQARVSFDYTHLGPEGADFFAAMVTRDLILAVPALRRVLVP